MQSLPSVLCNEILSSLTCASAWKTGTVSRSFWLCLTGGVSNAWELLPGEFVCWKHASLKGLHGAAATIPNLMDISPWNPDLGYAGSTYLLRPWYFTDAERSRLAQMHKHHKIHSNPLVLTIAGTTIKVYLALTLQDGAVSCHWSVHRPDCQDDEALHVEMAGHIIHPYKASIHSYGVLSHKVPITEEYACKGCAQIIHSVSIGEPLFCGLAIRCSGLDCIQEFSFV
eukprot:TRINITY_DN37312_c0_g1_i1.p1 TRINITY_DN37312_c0_g1~~TRINITY_DN37312_c0_g1_i1.p1  ORF type:complete len:227 (-),score=12.03 TRINITY_DN37312_c0_g1_i1:96-776(-)